MPNQPKISDLIKPDVVYKIFYKPTNPKLKGQWQVDQETYWKASEVRVELDKFKNRHDILRAEIVKEVTTRKVLEV